MEGVSLPPDVSDDCIVATITRFASDRGRVPFETWPGLMRGTARGNSMVARVRARSIRTVAPSPATDRPTVLRVWLLEETRDRRTDSEQLFVVSDSPDTASTQKPKYRVPVPVNVMLPVNRILRVSDGERAATS